MKSLPKGVTGIAAVAAGQAVTDEVVEVLAERYAVDKGVMVHLLIEAGVPLAAGVATHYVTDNELARNAAIGALATGTVNGIKIIIQQARSYMSQDDGSGDGTTAGVSGLGALTPQERRAVQSLSPQERRGFAQLSPAEKKRAARQLVMQMRQAQNQENPNTRKRSGLLGNGRSSKRSTIRV